MLSKSSHSFTPSPYGYSPCLGESADALVECIHCLSLWLLAKAAAFGRRPKGSVKPTALSPGQGDEHEVRRGRRVNWTTAILLPYLFFKRFFSLIKSHTSYNIKQKRACPIRSKLFIFRGKSYRLSLLNSSLSRSETCDGHTEGRA